MEGDENVSLQRAERGSGSTGGIKKKAKRTRGKQKGIGRGRQRGRLSYDWQRA